MAKESGTTKPSNSSNVNRDAERIRQFAAAALTGLLANRNYSLGAAALLAADQAVALNTELKNRGI